MTTKRTKKTAEATEPLEETPTPTNDAPGAPAVPAAPAKTTATAGGRLMAVPVESIDATHNIRKEMDRHGSLGLLAASIAELGQLHPAVINKVGGVYRLVVGHRRLAAAVIGGESHLEAVVHSNRTEVWEAKARLAENFQRDDLTHVELAMEFGRSREAGLTVAEIAAAAYASPDTVRRHLSLLRLCEPVRKLVDCGRLPLHQAELISRVGDAEGQVDLAEGATKRTWKGEKAGWTPELNYDKKRPTDERGDYVQPMESLRERVAWHMKGLAACGWPMGEPYEGKPACTGCEDNSATHADQPSLFAGIHPQGSAKAGHCTDAACYRAKSAAWEKVKAAKQKEKVKKATADVRKAQKAGLDVCEVHGCGRIAQAGETFGTCDEVGGVKACPKCEKKAKKAAKRGGGGREDYQARERRVAAVRKAFPTTPAEKFAVAVFKYGTAVAAAIAKRFAAGPIDGGPNRTSVVLALTLEPLARRYSPAPKGVPTLAQLAAGACLPDALLAAAFRRVATPGEYQGPFVDHQGRVENVPLAKEVATAIDGLEALAVACFVPLPRRPRGEDFEEAGTSSQEPGTGAETAERGTCVVCGCTDERACEGGCIWVDDAHTCCTRCVVTIVKGKKAGAAPAIGKVSLWVLQSIDDTCLKGDWRRAAVAKRIEQLEKGGA